MKLNFYKMHGAGNDYIFFDCFDKVLENPEKLSIKLSDRHFSVGGDGIVLVMRSKKADCRMRIFNADGSEAEMCGNAIRCVGKLAYELLSLRKNTVTVETAAGIKRLILDINNGKVTGAIVEMGTASFEPQSIPVLSENEMIESPIDVAGRRWSLTAVSMGNPHAVVFTDDVASLKLDEIGPLFENHTLFPRRINTEFARLTGENRIEMRVWERGSGETLACGTGASATAAAAVKTGRCKPNLPIGMKLRGGNLTITVKDDFSVIMKGACETAFTGSVEI